MRRFLSLLIVLVAVSAWAGSRAPVPKAVMEAKTAYVNNESWHTSVGDEFSDELSKWGRFKLVGDPNEADLVFRLTGSIEGVTTLDVIDARTQQKLWSNKPGKPRKLVNELRKRIKEQEKA